MTELSDLGSIGFADPTKAIRLRDVIRKIAEQEVGKLTSRQQVGRVVSANFGAMTAQVWIPGDPGPITVNLFSTPIPGSLGDQSFFQNENITSEAGPGSLVVIDYINGKLYITRVISGGEFTKNLGAAGLHHKSYNGLHVAGDGYAGNIYSITPPVTGNYGMQVSFFAPSIGQACAVGPFVGTIDGQFLPGHFKIYVTRDNDTAMFEANIEDDTIWPGSSTAATRWFRLLPQMMGSKLGQANIACDIGIRHTAYLDARGLNEIWLRFTDETYAGGVDFFYATVEAYGPLITFGDKGTGRIRVEDMSRTNYSGYLGFHDSQHLFRGREEESGKTTATLPTTDIQVRGFSGAWSSGPRNMWNDLRNLWFCDGIFTWDGTGIKWTGNIVFTGIGSNTYGLPNGSVKFPMVSTSTQIPVIPDDYFGTPTHSPVSVDATHGIPLAANQTLYVGIPPGMTTTTGNGMTDWHTLNWMFFIVDNSSPDAFTFNYMKPEWAIAIAHRGADTDLHRLQVYGNQSDLIDTTESLTFASTTSSGNLAATTTTKVWDIPSFTFRANMAYRVEFSVGAKSPTVPSFMQFWLVKGSTAGGTKWIDWLRTHLATASQVATHHRIAYVAPGGSDITTVTNISAYSSATNGVAVATDVATTSNMWLKIDQVGPSAKFPQALAIA